jgi:hypothetical protein
MPITRTLVTGALFTARLPLTLAQATLRRGGDADEWLPALAFESFEGAVKRCVGAFTHDEELAADGRLTQEKVRQFRMGVELETLAGAREQEADAEFNDRIEADAEIRGTISAQSEARKRAVDDRHRQQEREVAAQLEREAASASKAETRDKTAAARRERAARSKQVQAERTALADAQQALEAEKHIDEIDAHLEASKAARRAAE